MKQFVPAVRYKRKLKLGFLGPAGSGKTYSSILMGRGFVGDEGKIAFVDTENRSAELYAHLTPFDVMSLSGEINPSKYIGAIETAIEEQYDLVIVDSISPVWDYFLVEHGRISRRTGNSFTAWAQITPEYNDFVRFIKDVDIHLILTIRAKTKYDVSTGQDGKMKLRKIGIGPKFRDGIEYEPDLLLEMVNDGNDIIATVSKTRYAIMPLWDEFTPTLEHGVIIRSWLEGGSEPQKQVVENKNDHHDHIIDADDEKHKMRDRNGLLW